MTVIVDEQLTEEQRQEKKDEIINKINRKFRKFETNPVMQELRNLIIKYRLEGL